jgi:F-type H+-transporting ATPase subunit alpha
MEEFKFYLEATKEIGYINSFSHSIAFVSGLPSLKQEEMIITESGKRGIVHGLKKDLAEVLMIESEDLKIGEKVTRTGRSFEIKVGEGLLGRIINPIGKPIDNLGPIRGEKILKKIKEPAPSIMERKKINQPFETGVMIVDLFVPLGYGQRELVIGDAKTGKTTFLLQTIVSQVKKGIICIYVGISKKDTAIKLVEEYLKKKEVFKKTVIVHTTPDDSATLNYLAPYSGMAIAEYFRDRGNKVLIILDDLTSHAKIYREISLLLKRNPGRDCYPGEIFHIHAALLERAGNIKRNGKEVSITALPVAETLENDLSGYIQTNLMAMTDGHIFFDLVEFRKGKRPAVNIFLSVSRVGNQTKSKIEKNLANFFRKRLLDYQRISEFVKFGTELSPESQKILEFGQKTELLFNQSSEITIERETQIILLGLLISDFWKEKSQKEMRKEIDKILKASERKVLPSLGIEIERIKDIDHLKFLISEIAPTIERILKKF